MSFPNIGIYQLLGFKQIEAKYGVDKTIIQELNPQLSITLSGYEKLIDHLGKEETLEFFKSEMKMILIKILNVNELMKLKGFPEQDQKPLRVKFYLLEDEQISIDNLIQKLQDWLNPEEKSS